MKNKFALIMLIALLSIVTLTFVSCSNDSSTTTSESNDTSGEIIDESTIYTEEVIDEKFIKEKISEATAVYYKSSKDGKYGNDNYLFEATILPSEYTEVEYIESNGEQCIDTGIKYDDNLEFDLTFSNYTTSPYSGGIFGTEGWLFSLSRIEATRLIWVVEEFKTYHYNNFSPYKEYSIQCGKTYCTINDKSIVSSSGQNNFGTENITIFKTNTGYGSFRLHKFKITNGEEVLRNYIPCYRNYDEQVGLYDLVSNEFYTSSTSDNFITTIDDVEYKNLPSEFQQVEYIESSGTEYIDTNIIPTANTKWIINGEFLSKTETSMMGCMDSSSRFHIGVWSNSFHPGLYDGYSKACASDTDRHTFLLDASTANFILDDVTYNSSDWSKTITGNKLPNLNIYLFARNDNGEASSLSEFKLYSSQIYEGDTLVAEFIPCYRKADNMVGLYDTVSKVFFSNSGTGSFKKGANVEPSDSEFKNKYTQIEYIESTGTQYIDTGVKANSLTSFAVEYAISSLNEGDNYILGNDMVEIYPSSSSLSIKCGTETKTVNYLKTDTKLTISVAQGQIYYQKDGGELSTGDAFTTPFESTNNLYLFAINKESISYANSTKIFACKIYQGTVLVRDFIPVIQKENNEIGLYDKVEGKFYSNLGTGTFNTRYDYSKDKTSIKNLLNVESIAEGETYCHNVSSIGADNETGSLYATASGTDAYTDMSYTLGYNAKSSWTLIPVEEEHTYRLSFDAVKEAFNAIYINYFNEYNVSVYLEYDLLILNHLYDYYYCDITIPKDENIKFIWFEFGKFDSKEDDVISITNAQFRETTSALSFVPYSGSTTKSYYSDIQCVSTIKSPYIDIDDFNDLEEPILNEDKSYSNELSNSFDTSLDSLTSIPNSLFENQSDDGSLLIKSNIYGHDKVLEFISNGGNNRCYLLPVIDLKANQTFTISFDCYSSKEIEKTMRFELNTGDYTWWGKSLNYTTPGTWQRLSLTYTVTSDTKLFYFIYGEESVPVYFDNFQLVYGTESDYTYGVKKYYERDTYTFISETANECDCIFFEDEDSTPNKIYSAQVYDGKNLIYNFKPSTYQITSKDGLYETVNKVFYLDDGIGNFSYSTTTILPSEFQQVEYIKCDGNQYIDTNFMPNQDTKVEMYVTTSGSYGYYFGCWDIAYNDGAYCLGNDGTKQLYVGYGNQGGACASMLDSKAHLLVKDKNKVYVDGNLYVEHNYLDFQTHFNLYLFTQNRAGIALKPTGERDASTSMICCAYCKIYDNGTLIRHYIPCYRISDKVAGMYDLVTEMFYSNSGSGDFKCGENVNSTNYDEDISSQYETLESLEIDGTRNIDLNISGDAKYIFDIKFKTGISHRQLMGYNTLSSNYWGVSTSGEYETYTSWKIKAGNRDTIIDEYKDGKISRYVNSTLAYEGTYSSLDNETYTIGTLSSLKKFACYCTLYSLKIEQNGKLIRDYIPAKRLLDSSIGLFDTITQQFITVYSNTTGFTHGDEVGHSFDDGTVITEVSEKQDGDILYTCKVCGKEIHKHIDSYSYSVTFNFDEGVDHIKVFKGYDLSSYEDTNVAYTRNQNTNNFSRINGMVYFEIVLKDGYSIDKISTGGTLCTNVEGNIYRVSYISANTIYSIKTTQTA